MISKLIVDGSYCAAKKIGGVGGYILNEQKQLFDYFSYKSESPIFEHQYELLSIIAGLQLALRNKIEKINVFNDDHSLINQIYKMNRTLKKSCLEKKILLMKLKELIGKFIHVQFFIYKCSYAHHLSRQYIRSDEFPLEVIIKSIQENTGLFNKIRDMNPAFGH